MVIGKITSTTQLDELIAHITLRIGYSPTHQDVMDFCVSLGYRHIDELISLIRGSLILDQKKFDKIQHIRKELAEITWSDPDPDQDISEVDRLLYSGS